MAKKEKSPFEVFVEEMEEIRKRPLDKEKVRRINEMIDESECEEEEEVTADESQIAHGGPAHSLEEQRL